MVVQIFFGMVGYLVLSQHQGTGSKGLHVGCSFFWSKEKADAATDAHPVNLNGVLIHGVLRLWVVHFFYNQEEELTKAQYDLATLRRHQQASQKTVWALAN